MKKLFSFALLAALAGGIIWYENHPQTITIPVKTDDFSYQDDYQELPSDPPTTTTQPRRAEVDFSKPDMRLDVKGVNGDDVVISEVIGKPKHLTNLPADVESMIRSCEGVTDRDMAIQVDSKVELTSSLPAEIMIDYQTLGKPAVYQFTHGLKCSDGKANHKMQPGTYSHLTYWVVLSGVVTPDRPNGDLRNSWSVHTPTLTLPNLERVNWKLSGSRTFTCHSLLGDDGKIWLAGPSLAQTDDCDPVSIS